MPTFRVLRLLLALVLFLDSRRLFVDAHIFSWLVDWQTVCEPDFIQCPNGGLTFRDRKHGCEFTPCELIPNPPLPPPPPDPKTLSVSRWFGRYEFMVPTFDTVALRRGKAVEREWTQSIVTKREQPMRANFSATIDLYIVAQPPSNKSASLAHATHAQDLHLDALIASQVELFVEEDGGTSSSSSSQSGSCSSGFSSTARDLAVSTPPWTRWEFFGQFGGSSAPPTLLTIQTALRLLKNSTTTAQSPTTATSANGFSTLVVEAATDVDIMTELLSQCNAAIEMKRNMAFTPRASTPAAPSALVFTTDFRAAVGSKGSLSANDEMLGPWNMTRVQCDEAAVAKAVAQLEKASNASVLSSITLDDPTTQLLWRPRNTSQAVDAGDEGALHTLSNRTNCSCWTRSLVGPRDHTTKWMFCE